MIIYFIVEERVINEEIGSSNRRVNYSSNIKKNCLDFKTRTKIRLPNNYDNLAIFTVTLIMTNLFLNILR